MRKITVNRKNSLLTKRVSTLLENKSSSLKKKFELLSILSEMKLNKDRISELECYTNTLLESAGNKPDFVSLNNYVLNVMKENRIYNRNSVMLTVENYLNLKYKNNITESIIEEELNSIYNNDYELNNKLYETLLYAVENKKSIFLEAADDDDWRNNVIDAADLLKVANTAAENDYESKVVDAADLLGMPGKPSAERQAKVARSPEGSKGRYQSKGLRGMSARKINQEVDKMEPEVLAIIKKQSNEVKRKFYLFFSIHYFLRVQRILTPPGLDTQVTSTTDQSEYSAMKSGLSLEEINVLEKQWDEMLERGSGRLEEDLADDSLFPEAELVALLRRSAGKDPEQVKLVDDVIESLNREFPSDNTSDDSEEEYELDDGIIAMSAEEMEKYEAELDKKYDEEDAEQEARNLEIGGMTTSKFNDIVAGRASLTEIDVDSINDEQLKILSDTFSPEVIADMVANLDQRRQEELSLRIIINCDKKSKSEIYRELMQRSASPEEFEAYVRDFFGASDIIDKPMSYADIARASGGDFTGSAGARQEIMKTWFKTLFLSSDDDAKSVIYANLGDRWFEALRLLDLVEDETVSIPGEKSFKGSKLVDYFEKVEGILTNKKNILDYIDGSMESSLASDIESMRGDSPDAELDQAELEKLKILDVLFTNNTSFRIFASKILDKFYHEEIWNQSEKDLAQAIKEYFNKYFPAAKIDASGKLTKGKVSGVIDKDEGRALFNPIIYWVMGRTGIKDKESKVSDASTMSNERIVYFRKKFPSVVEKYNESDAGVKLVLTSGDIEDLIDDMLDPNGIIGSVLEDKRKLSPAQVSEIVDWIASIPTGKIEEFLSDSLLYAEKYRAVLADSGLFNKKVEDTVRQAARQILGDYTGEYKTDLKKHSQYTSDEFGYSRR